MFYFLGRPIKASCSPLPPERRSDASCLDAALPAADASNSATATSADHGVTWRSSHIRFFQNEERLLDVKHVGVLDPSLIFIVQWFVGYSWQKALELALDQPTFPWTIHNRHASSHS